MGIKIQEISLAVYEYMTESLSDKDAAQKMANGEPVSPEELNGTKDKKTIVLWENGKPTDASFQYMVYGWVHKDGIGWREKVERIAEDKFSFEVSVKIKLGDKVFDRTYKIECPTRKREVVMVQNNERVIVLVEPQDYESSLLECIIHYTKNFCLTERELLSEAHRLIAQEYTYTNFKHQVEISGCIADGLAFVGTQNDHNCKIIGFEAKANTDNYKRLYSQLNAYLAICDEVYLVIEDKNIPKDLPFFVGVISVANGDSKVIRKATSLKHDIDAGDCWKTLLKTASHHAGLDTEDKLTEFFNSVENIKRKLIWNQFVLGFHQTYVKEYIPLTDAEKRLMKAYFFREQVKIKQEDNNAQTSLMQWIAEGA